MKTLKKICLNNISMSLSDTEMKNVVGGYDGGSGTYDDPYQLPEVVVGAPCITPKICACFGKLVGDYCAFKWTNNGVELISSGSCRYRAFNTSLYCVDTYYV